MTSLPNILGLVDAALTALNAALAARAVYWPEHASAKGPLQRAAGLLTQALELNERLPVMLLPDRVILLGTELPSSPRLAASLGKRLRARGAECITFSQGLAIDELDGLLGLLGSNAASADPLPRSAHVIFEGLGLSGTGGSAGQPIGGAPTAPATSQASAAPTAHAPVPALAPIQTLHCELTSDVSAASDKTERIELAAASVLGFLGACRGGAVRLAAMKSHDEYTYIHASNVAVLSGALAEAIGLPAAAVRDITIGALLHDIGKERIPPAILNKEGKLDARELAIVREHPVDGARMLAAADGVPDTAIIIAYEHHMHPDGTGYPKLAPGRTLHLASRIVQLADVYDALGTHRSYRAALAPAKIREIMSERAGGVYEADLFGVFFDSVIRRLDESAKVERLAA